MSLKNSILPAIALTISAAATPTSDAAASDDTLLFGIVPQQSATRLAQIWAPFMDKLSKETGLKVRFATTKDIPSFEKCLAKGAYEFAYMNPYHYTVFSASAGYKAFARQAKKRLQGLIVVKKDNPATGLADLNGKDIAFPSPAAFGASVLPRAEMTKKGILHTPHYVKSHDSVYRAVTAGIFPAGGGVKRTFGNLPEGMRAQLRVIYRTERYTPHAFAALSRISPEAVANVTNAMLKIGNNEPTLMKPLGINGFEAAENADWDDVRALGLSNSQTELAEEGNIKCRSD